MTVPRRAMIRVRRSALAFAFLALASAAPAGAAPDGQLGGASLVPAGAFIHVEGKRFVGPDGRTFALKGMSLGNWLMPEGYMFGFRHALSPREINGAFERILGRAAAAAFWRQFRENFIGEDDIRFLAQAGFTIVRVPIHYGLFLDSAEDAKFDGPGYRLLDRLIGWSRAAALRVIIDMHAAPGGQTGVNHDDGTGYPLSFYVPRYHALTIRLWRHLAERYRDESAVLGYDLLNEPISPYLDADYLNPRLEPFYREITAAIRAVDPNHVVFLAAAQWSTNFAVFGPPFAANVAYSYHKFWASTDRDSIQSYVDFANRYDVPIFLGETGELNDAWNAAFRRLNEAHGIGWCFWTYKNLESTSTVVSISRPPGWEAVIAIADGPPGAADDGALRERAAGALKAYLEAIRFRNGRINRGYLASLGLAAPSP